MRINLDVNISAKCRDCGNELAVHDAWDNGDGITVSVLPCEACIIVGKPHPEDVGVAS